MNRFNSVLVANRGEIACRVIRTAKALGYRTVAVYSEADEAAPHTQMADDAVCIGPSPVNESYMVIDKIIDAARQSGAQAIHPGYGFLSENAGFAEACKIANLVFIGPDIAAIEVMGNKAAAKRHMISAQVPCVPGYEGEDQDDQVLLTEAEKIGVPIMVKAAAGGGGRGMRLVRELAELPKAIRLARSEAENAFGSGELIMEKAIIEPRHVEVQVFADQQGNTVYLGERDCSVQRRHQKVIEEAPCPVMTDELRRKMGEAAVAAARSIKYVGAGTVEFLLDAQGEFYFLEMNTRLQVEHPVTELITGLDLVALQLQVAQGEQLGFDQQDVRLSGHAMEVRLYTEDPAHGFLPTSGTIEHWHAAEGEGVRVDGGIVSGQHISPFYDPMIAKLIASGPNREVARRRLLKALKQTALFGVKNNKAFLIACLQKQTFIDGAATTAFIDREFDATSLAERQPSFTEAALAAVLHQTCSFQELLPKVIDVAPGLHNWSSVGPLVSRKLYRAGDVQYDLYLSPSSNANRNSYTVNDGDRQGVNVKLVKMDKGAARLLVDDRRIDVQYYIAEAGSISLSFDDMTVQFVDQLEFAGIVEEGLGGGRVVAPMHGLVLELLVAPGQMVKKDQGLLILEAMKMQHEILASADGVIVDVFAKQGAQVATDEILVEIDVAANINAA